MRPTQLGERLRERVSPAYDEVQLALDATRTEANAPTGPIRLGFTTTAEDSILSRLVEAFQARHPGHEVTFHELDVLDFHFGLRKRAIDVLHHHLPVREPGFTAGPALAQL